MQMMTPLDASDPRPPYRQIASRLRDDIQAGRVEPGGRLPSERELLEEYGTAYATVRQALGMLKAEGLVDSVQGLGYFVRQPLPVIHPRHGTGHFVLDARAQDRNAEQRLIEVSVREAPPHLVGLLELEQTEQVILRRNMILLDDRPVQLIDSYFPATLFGETRIGLAVHTPPMRGGPHADRQRATLEPDPA